MSASQQKWWKTATMYQVYPASYMDSNGDGIGDLPGILSKLDYIKSIGIDCVWISPFYQSPNEDQGYDIADYQRPDPAYGKLEDIDAIIRGCHERDMKILFDLVCNHTSRQHRWFKESRSSKDNPYRKYYIWRPPRYINGERYPPTNWEAVFGGSAWEWDETTQEYYLHLFTVGQPDLNFEEPEVRQAIYKEAILFWLERGVDGMRVDVSNFYSKDAFEDVEIVNPQRYLQPAQHKYIDGPKIIEYLKELQENTFSKYDAVTVAEMPGKRSFERMLEFVGASSKVFSMAITFDLMGIDHHGKGFYKCVSDWSVTDIKKITKTEQRLADPNFDAWVCNYLENHDQARSVSRFMSDAPEHRVISAKTLATYLLTLSGTPIVYQGQEIGMVNFSPEWGLEEYDDPASKLFMQDIREAVEKLGRTDVTIEDGMNGLRKLARDHARTPMQWSDGKQAGFSQSEKTWMRVMESHKEINVAAQEKDPHSVLNFYRKLLQFRQEHKNSLIFGTYEALDDANEKTMTYLKKGSESTLLIALNFKGELQPVYTGDMKVELLLSTSTKPDSDDNLQPYEGRIYRVVN